MSRLLTNKKIIVVCSILISIILLYTNLWIISMIILSITALYIINKLVYKKSNKIPFLSAKRKIKKYQYLIIGDTCSHSILKKYISRQENSFMILSPRRSLDASYQILLHTISILDEDGTCIIIDSGDYHRKTYTILDIPYLNPITRKELKIETLKKKESYPLFFEPLKSILIILNIPTHKKYKDTHCSDKRFTDFFQHRKNKFIYLKA